MIMDLGNLIQKYSKCVSTSDHYIKIGLLMVNTPLFVSCLTAGETCHPNVHDIRGIFRALRDNYEVHRSYFSILVVNPSQDGLRERHI